MANFISVNSWLWGGDTPMEVKVSKMSTSYYMKFSVGLSNVDLALEKKDLVMLRDKINEALLVEDETNEQ